MNRVERLAGIRVKLVGLLKIAERRTPGKWEVNQSKSWDRAVGIEPLVVQRNAYTSLEDAAFITSCAGNAEAGWRSTVAVIDHISELLRHPLPELTAAAEALADVILNEWEGAL